MKSFYYIVVVLLLTSCSAAKMTDTWVNKEYTNYQPKKVLIVGLTDNLIARKMFEEQLKTELINRGIDAVESYDVFKPTFTSLKQTEEDIENEVKRISNEGFDAILISAVKGIEEKVSYSGDTYRRDYYWRRFGRYYYLVQDVYLIEGYYNKYDIYHIEASLYNLKENNDKSLVWVASYDIVDPKRINTTVTNYVTAIIKSLEEKRIINENYMP
ncbi:hypothetical protein MWU58_09155 [Flavobacteriaceae bacterium S0825]|uniref:hypothetical protein n=1 Tax=Gaetbulibacter sp. S0825 TaxID=2720084 RepID=UPI001431D426|nr:hypothetical protein [Gaetbulibacter sp. S0825]MCK0109460.1 hypothetical protein [Flavobacteriaceae bacterium S0825]NIX65095.1 hypothetical protein [Gaetbulibacter sp. S0825]